MKRLDYLNKNIDKLASCFCVYEEDFHGGYYVVGVLGRLCYSNETEAVEAVKKWLNDEVDAENGKTLKGEGEDGR